MIALGAWLTLCKAVGKKLDRQGEMGRRKYFAHRGRKNKAEKQWRCHVEIPLPPAGKAVYVPMTEKKAAKKEKKQKAE